MQFFLLCVCVCMCVCICLPASLSVCIWVCVCVRCEGMLQALWFQVLFSENREIAYLNVGVI